MTVPGLGRNLFFYTEAMRSGVRTILDMGNLHLRINSNSPLPLNQHPEQGRGFVLKWRFTQRPGRLAR